MNLLRRHIAPWMFVALLLANMLAGCERKELYLAQRGMLSIDVSVYDIQLDLMWGLEWKTEWQYLWDESLYGPIGYGEPSGVRANVYSINEAHQRTKYTTRNLPKNGGQVSLTTNLTYDMVFYNNDTESILFSTDDSTYYYATTRGNTRNPYTRAYEHYNQPDQLFGTYLHDLYVSDDPDQYIVETAPDGSLIYVFDVDASLTPYTYIYLCQVMLLNNKDEMGTRVEGAEGISISGLAGGVDLFTRTTDSTHIVVVTQDDVKPLQEDRTLKLPDGSTVEGDILAARVMTWGLPGIDPLEQSRTRVPAATVDSTVMAVGLKLRNGTVYPVEMNISDIIKQRAAGGVISMVIDAAEIPDSIIGGKPKPGGGFDASVDNWENEIETDIII